MDDPANFFVISTDFCHWGTRFDFVSYDKTAGSIPASIEALDRQGMYCITEQDASAFTSYLKKTGNTICGRHPIGVLLKAIEHATTPFVSFHKDSIIIARPSAIFWKLASSCFDASGERR